MSRSTILYILAALAVPVSFAAAPKVVAGDPHQDVLNTVARFQKNDPSMQKFFNEAVGYAVFPTVGEGAVGVGAAHGDGELLVGGKAIGRVAMTQVTVGLQLGGESYSEIIFFSNEHALDGFKHGDFAFAAEAKAVALASGAAANAAYRDGVAVFTSTIGGLMYQASIGGQKFSFKPFPTT
jgi:lipid-binding SYLF domain-containing protein